jgi:hypothetical protein
MTDKTFKFWTEWLLIANVLSLAIGFLTAFAGNSWLFQLHNEGTSDTFFSGQPLNDEVLKLKNWLFGIIGGCIVGFHILMIFITKYAFSKKENWAYRALCIGLLSWFLIDTSISFYYHAYYNIYLINVTALILIGLPLLMTRKEFFCKTSNY